MSGALTVRVQSPQPPAQSASTKGLSRKGSDAASSGAGGFDGVLAGHAQSTVLPPVKSKPTPVAQRPGADRDPGRLNSTASSHLSPHGAKSGPAPERARPDAERGDDAAAQQATHAQGATVADPANPPAAGATGSPDDGSTGTGPAGSGSPDDGSTGTGPLADGAAGVSAVGAPAPGVGVVPPTATSGSPATSAGVSGIPAHGPGAGTGDGAVAGTPAGAVATVADGAAVAANGTGVTPGQNGSERTGAGAILAGQQSAGAAGATPTHPGGGPGADPGSVAGVSTTPASVIGPVLSVPVPPTTPTIFSAPAANGQAPLLVPVPVHHQVFTAFSPLLRGGDGSYHVQLQLHPLDLGAVQVSVEVRHGEVSIRLNAPDPAARDALRNGLSDLRQQLEDQGLRAGSMEVGSGGANPQQPRTPWSRPQSVQIPAGNHLPSDQLVATAGAASSTTLDLQL